MAENCGCKYDAMSRVPQEPVDMTAALWKLPPGTVDMAESMRRLPLGAVDMTASMRKPADFTNMPGLQAKDCGCGFKDGKESGQKRKELRSGRKGEAGGGSAAGYAAAPADCEALCASEHSGDFRALWDCIHACRREPGLYAEENCPAVGGHTLSPPDFREVHWATQFCFWEQYGQLDWPATDCCPVEVKATNQCDLPTAAEWFDMWLAVPEHELVAKDGQSNYAFSADPAGRDKQLFASALAILMKNVDIALWASCLVQKWSPELWGIDLTGCLSDLLTRGGDGKFPWTITYVNARRPRATAWAFTPLDLQEHPKANEGKYGVVIPLNHDWWKDQAIRMERAGIGAFCSMVQVSAVILHELIHICGDSKDSGVNEIHTREGFNDNPGTLHDTVGMDLDNDGVIDEEINYQNTCWDEARMIQHIYTWALGQRYTCLTQGSIFGGTQPSPCQHELGAWNFAISNT